MVMAAGLRRALKGLSEAAFRERFGTEEACRKALFEMRWRQGLSCPACGHKRFCQLKTRELFQCNRCKRQVRLTAGTVFQDSKLPLTTWFAAIYHLTQSKNGISSIELGRRLGVKRQTAWPEFAVGGERAGIRAWFQELVGHPDLPCAHKLGGAGWFSRRRGSSWVLKYRAF